MRREEVGGYRKKKARTVKYANGTGNKEKNCGADNEEN